MAKYIIADIDKRINGHKSVSLQSAMTSVRNWIIRNIDNTFPEAEFNEWLDSDLDGPFKWNGNNYYWS